MGIFELAVEFIKCRVLKEEYFKTHINQLCIKVDKIPNPTTEEREVSNVPCLAHRTTARNAFGRFLLKRCWQKGGFDGPASLTQSGTVLEVYPIPFDRIV